MGMGVAGWRRRGVQRSTVWKLFIRWFRRRGEAGYRSCATGWRKYFFRTILSGSSKGSLRRGNGWLEVNIYSQFFNGGLTIILAFLNLMLLLVSPLLAWPYLRFNFYFILFFFFEFWYVLGLKFGRLTFWLRW